jgi:hypothetical protein
VHQSAAAADFSAWGHQAQLGGADAAKDNKNAQAAAAPLWSQYYQQPQQQQQGWNNYGGFGQQQ